ncbi:phosphate ABC transporter permease PstA, partial [Streptomyces goshikiensis]
MSHALQDQRPTPARKSPAPASLTRGGLPRWAPAGIAVLSIALGCGIGVVADLHSKIQWGLIASLLFIAITYTASAVVENRRQAKDRVTTSLVWVCFILAVIPLLSLIWTTVSRGMKALDGDFISHSMNGVTSFEEGGGVYHALLGTIEQIALATVIAAPIGLL